MWSSEAWCLGGRWKSTATQDLRWIQRYHLIGTIRLKQQVVGGSSTDASFCRSPEPVEGVAAPSTRYENQKQSPKNIPLKTWLRYVGPRGSIIGGNNLPSLSPMSLNCMWPHHPQYSWQLIWPRYCGSQPKYQLLSVIVRPCASRVYHDYKRLVVVILGQKARVAFARHCSHFCLNPIRCSPCRIKFADGTRIADLEGLVPTPPTIRPLIEVHWGV